MTRIVTDEDLNEFLGYAQQVVDADYVRFTRNSNNTRTPIIEFDNITERNKYARIWSDTASGCRSAWGFIGLNDGNVWKCDGWKKPVLNFKRGNIYDADHGLGRAAWTGIS